MTRRLLLLGALLVLCGVPLIFWLPVSESTVQHRARWIRVEPQLLESQLGLVGRIQAGRQYTLVAPFDGLIAALSVEEGQQAESGQTLMVLDTSGLEIRLRQAEAEVLKAREVFRQLQSWQNGPEVARARRVLDSARGTLAASQAALDDTRRLFERGIVARLEVDNLVQQVWAQRQGVVDAQQELVLTRARGEGDALRIAQMELANAQARWQALLQLREQRVLKAPFAALVTRVSVGAGRQQQRLQVGQQVTQGLPLVTLMDLGRLQVLAKVEQGDLGNLQAGMSVQVMAAGRQFDGRVQWIAAQAREDEGQGSWYDLLVAFDVPSEPLGLGLRLGMSAQLMIIVHRNERGIALPPEALRVDEAGQAHVIFRKADDQPERTVPVEVVASVAQGVEVSGLEAGYVRMP